MRDVHAVIWLLEVGIIHLLVLCDHTIFCQDARALLFASFLLLVFNAILFILLNDNLCNLCIKELLVGDHARDVRQAWSVRQDGRRGGISWRALLCKEMRLAL